MTLNVGRENGLKVRADVSLVNVSMDKETAINIAQFVFCRHLCYNSKYHLAKRYFYINPVDETGNFIGQGIVLIDCFTNKEAGMRSKKEVEHCEGDIRNAIADNDWDNQILSVHIICEDENDVFFNEEYVMRADLSGTERNVRQQATK